MIILSKYFAILYRLASLYLTKNYFMHRLFYWSLVFALVNSFGMLLHAQQDSLPPTEAVQDANPDLVEDFLQANEEGDGFEFNTLFEELEIYRNKPLDLNKASREDLESLLLLSDIQINDFINYRTQAGDLVAIYELQAIPSFDLNTIATILPFVKVGGALDDFQLPLPQMIIEGKNELFMRWSRVLEAQRGFSDDESVPPGSRYEGDPNKLYLRYRHSYSNRLRYGFTAEKDPGEAFFQKSNQQGFDYYSAHFYLRDYNSWLKTLAIGDYNVSFGQGLILYSGFGRRKSSQVLNIKRNARTIRPYSSVDENNFMRGAAITTLFGKHIEFTALASFNRRDANILLPDTLDNEDLETTFSSLQLSGLHRTANEIADENALSQWVLGGSLQYSTSQWRIGLNTLYNRFDKSLNRTIQPYNRFYFNDDQLINVSVDYNALIGSYNFFGETAISDNGKMATTNGLLIGLDPRLNIALLHRYFSRAYQVIDANPFSESSGANNENGFYIGMEYQLDRHWKLSSYADLYRHPWLRFGVDAPSKGTDYRIRLTYYQKRKLEVYLELRDERKERNAPQNSEKTDVLVEARLTQARAHVTHTVSKQLRLKSRVDFGFFKNGVGEKLKGFVVYQDLIFKPRSFPVSFSTRFALFDTPSYNLRFYSYENDLLYSFSIPAYYDTGTRFYFNLRYRASRWLTLEARYAQTYWSELNVIGSGGNRIEGNTRSEVKAQLKLQF